MKRILPALLKATNILIIFAACQTAHAQVKDSLNMGQIKGSVKDTAFNFVLSSATVTVYKDSDSSLLKYSLPNSFGEFSLNSLPVETPLRIIITHVGYRSFIKKFSVRKDEPIKDLGQISMQQKTDEDDALSEVIVTAVVPMRMNGDTLEFNANAFKLDKNATTEDLIRKLPGFTIWGDGEITFNGKKITTILVEGKPFMGGDFASATQNLPKDALQKVQVYQQVNENNPLDSTMQMNLKLKEDKKMGYFGKLSGGLGSDGHYAADGMMSGFNKKMQVSIVGATNDINKTAGNVKTLMTNSSFKGVGANIDYQSDFKMAGLNKPTAAGFTFQYDYVPNAEYRNQKRLNADYYINSNNNLTQRNSTTRNFLGKDSLLTQQSVSSNSNSNTSQRFNGSFIKNSNKTDINISTGLSLNNNQSFSQSTSQQERTGAGITPIAIGTNQSNNEGNSESKNYNMRISLRKKEVDRNRVRPREFNVNYNFGLTDNNARRLNNTQFRSAISPGSNRDYSRLYQNQDAFSVNNSINVEYPSLQKLIFGRKRLANISIGFSTGFNFHNNDYEDKVLDYDTTIKKYQTNEYLTNNRDLNIRNILPSLNFSKSFYKQLSNRYFKYGSINVNMKGQHYNMQHSADRSFQNFNYTYNRFIPNAELSYNNNQYGNYETTFRLGYSTAVNYPEVNHIAPLIDSANIWNFQKGNPNIRPEYEQRISYSFNFQSRRPKNPSSINVSVSIGKTDDKMADSSFYDALGRRLSYAINVDGHQFLNGNLSYKKSLQKKKNTFQFGLNSNFNVSKDPNYVNNLLNISSSRRINNNLSVDYSFKDIVTLRASQQASFYRSQQRGFNNNLFNNKTFSTEVSGSLQMPKDLNWSSNITFNRNTANNQQAINFAIWNASLTYRFMKGNRGEVKFSALDLLHQNKSIINYGGTNSQTFGYANVLQQYYMITLSYFPRKFGK